MKNFTRLFGWFSLAALLLWSYPRPLHAADAVVGSGTAASCTESAFDAALLTVGPAGGKITFNCGGPAAITFTDQKIIPGPTIIDGAGQITLSGASKTRLFFVNSGLSLTLQGLTLRDGAASVGGGLIEIFGGALSISDSTLRDSTAVTDGGAINCSTDNGGSITISDTTLSGNTAVKGGAIYSGGCALTFQDSQFSANKTTGAAAGTSLGGAVFLDGPGQLLANNVAWSGNEARDGGALLLNSLARAQISGGRFTANKADFGAGIESFGDLELTGTLFENNEAATAGAAIWNAAGELAVLQGTMRGNTAVLGGAVYANGPSSAFFGVTFSGNRATISDGGAIYISNGRVVIDGSTLDGNIAAGQNARGGAIFQGDGSLQLSNSTLTANSAPLGSGGGLYHSFGPATLLYVTLADNVAPAGSQLYKRAGSGLLTLFGSALQGDLNSCNGEKFTSYSYNRASSPCPSFNQPGDKDGLGPLGLGSLQDNGGLNGTHTMMPALNSPLVDAIPAADCAQETQLDQRDEKRPFNAACDVGAVERQAADLTASDLVVGTGSPASCTEAAFEAALLAARTLPGKVTFNCGGPATIPLTSAKLIETAVTIDGADQITLTGGGNTPHFEVAPLQLAQFAADSGGDLTLENILLTDGFSYVDGGSIANNGRLTLRHVTIRGSKTDPTFAGGAIASSGPLYIENSLLENNEAGNGGALYLTYAQGSALISDSILRNNKASSAVTTGYGGAAVLWNGAELAALRTRFENNEAAYGGAIYGATEDTLIHLVDNSAVTANKSRADMGGGIYTEGRTDLYGVTLSDNIGAAVFNRGYLSALASTFSGNFSEGGAGISNFGQAEIINTTLSGNEAGLGGGLFNYGTAVLTHVTFAGNTAGKGTAIYQVGSNAQATLTMQNVLLGGGSPGSNCAGENPTIAPIVSLGHNLSSDASCRLTMSTDQPDTDPLLGPLADNGGPTLTHLPAVGSPAIDQGLCLETAKFDQRDFKRPFGPTCDIGAVEAQPFPGPNGNALYLPFVRG